MTQAHGTGTTTIKITPAQRNAIMVHFNASESLMAAFDAGMVVSKRRIYFLGEEDRKAFGQFIGMREDIARDNLADGGNAPEDVGEYRATLTLARKVREAGIDTR